jgi:pseudaminic acid biosynthesis-associated methylase
MPKTTHQTEEWSGDFGRKYTDRNALTVEEMDAAALKRHGIIRSELYSRFVGGMDRSIRILEVGSNVGNQLRLLQRMGFKNLFGIELQPYAVELSKSHTKDVNIIQGSAFDIPFKDGWFDLVFTSGVLIHIHPDDTLAALAEVCRCSSAFVLGFEYYADELTEVEYRGQESLLWKRDFPRLYLEHLDSLELVREERIPHVDGDNVDTMFLLKKAR